jgi:capsular exopolysaccharide synthesis family protein
MASQRKFTAEDAINLEAILSEFRKYSKIFILIFLFVFPAVFALNYFKAPTYTSTARVMITNENEQALPGIAKNDSPIDTATIESEVEMLDSIGVAERVVRDLQLLKDPEFNGSGQSSGFSLSAIKGWIKGILKPAPVTNEKGELDPVTRVANNLLGNVDISRVGSTRVISITYTSTSKTKAALIANAWTGAYLQAKIDSKEAINRQANGWLNPKIEELRAQVEAADRAVQEYKIRYNLLSATGSTMAEQEISDLNRQLATVRVDQAESTARLATARRQLANGSNGDDVGESLNSSVVGSLRTQAAQISSKLAELQTRYGPAHPEVVRAKNQLADVNGQIQSEIGRIISNLEAQDQIQRQRAASLMGSVGAARGQLASNSKAMVKLNELELNAQAVRQIYESYLDRLKLTASQSGSLTTNATIVDEAKPAEGPSSPKLPVALLLAFSSATIVSGGAVMIRRSMDSGLVTSQDVEKLLSINHLASIPDLASTVANGKLTPGIKPHQHLVQRPLSAFAEGFRNLRASMLYANDQQPRVVAITSALPAEGKTTTTVCLAAAFVMAGSKVIVVDCDLRRRSVSGIFGKSFDKGLVEVMSGKSTLDEAVQKDDLTGVAYLPVSDQPVTTLDLFGSDMFDKLLDDLKKAYDIILLDTAPILPVADTRILARKADFVALLVKWRQTPRRAVQAALEIIESSDVKVSGAALVQVNIKQQSKYGYGDSGYYYKDYKNYYLDAS